MKIFILDVFEKLKAWTLKWSHSRHMAAALFFIALIEAVFFPIPPDILMAAILMINSRRWWYYAGITTAGSVVGAACGYLVGWLFYSTAGHYIVDAYNLQEMVNLIGQKYTQHVFLTVFTAAFTPIPFKLITVTAGLFGVPFIPMIVASIIGRGMRYFMVAYIIKIFGKKINYLVFRYFNILSFLFVALLIGGFFAIKFLF